MLRIIYTPFLKMNHQLCPYHIQKFPKGMAYFNTPFPKTATLTMPHQKAVHQKYHMPMAIYGLFISDLILVKTKIIFATLVEFVYLVSITPTVKQKRSITVNVIGHKDFYLIKVLFRFTRFSNQYPTFAPSINFSSAEIQTPSHKDTKDTKKSMN